MLLVDKVVVVSGLGPGLGIQLALESAREGARAVVACSRSDSLFGALRTRLDELGTTAELMTMTADTTDPAQCRRVAGEAADRFGTIDGLVNNAFDRGQPELLSVAAQDPIRHALDVNLFGTLNMTQAIAPVMTAAGAGSIVMVSTMAVRKVMQTEFGGYAISKAPLAAAVKHLAAELGASGVRVNLSSHGYMWGHVLESHAARIVESGGSADGLRSQIAAMLPLARVPTDTEHARAVLFLLSDYSSAITGATLDVNAGDWMPQ